MENKFRIDEVLSRSFEIYFRNLGPLLLIGLAAYLPIQLIQQALAAGMTGEMSGAAWLVWGLSVVVGVILSYVMQGAVVFGVYQNLNGRPFRIGRCVSVAVGRMWVILGVSIVASLLIGIGLMLLIIPGIIIALVLWVAVPAAVVERRGVGDSLGRSRELTDGSRLRIFGLLVIIGIISGALTFGVSMIMGLMMSAGGGSSIGFILVSALTSALVGLLQSVVTAVGYYYLRMDVEGLDVSEIVAVFD
jgi:hypothetical protein